MSSRFPTRLTLSLEELARHGGETGPHSDGWGVALFEEGDALVLREPEAASESPLVGFLGRHARRSELALAHIRKATQGARGLRNTQPFSRELGGRTHVFAHNGTLRGLERDPRFAPRRFLPVGETDSERAFCALLERLAPLWEQGAPSLDARLDVVVAFARALRPLGPANFLYADGEAVFAHAHRRTQADGEVRPPGLHALCRRCSAHTEALATPGVSVPPGEEQHVALVASVPLSDESWEALREGEVVVLQGGYVARRVPPSE